MAELITERTVICPSCWEPTSITVDLTTAHEHFVEDCQVCCNPISITLDIEDGEIVNLQSEMGQ